MLVVRVYNNIVKYIPISNKSFVIHENDGNIVIALNQVLKSEEISSVTIYNTEGIIVANFDIQTYGYTDRLEINNLRLKAGAYIIRVNSSNGKMLYSGRLMVVR